MQLFFAFCRKLMFAGLFLSVCSKQNIQRFFKVHFIFFGVVIIVALLQFHFLWDILLQSMPIGMANDITIALIWVFWYPI
jgi:hypothetical protein